MAPSDPQPTSPPAAPPQPVAKSSDVAAPAPPTPPVAAAPAGSVAVQVGAFSTSEAAESLATALRAKGFATYVSPGTKAGSARWRVRVGPLATREEAEVTAARLEKSEQLPTWILNEDAG
jgi:DedD protein